jgi:chloride channel protein, CIC family
LLGEYFFGDNRRTHPGYPVVDRAGKLLGVITRSNLLENWISGLVGGTGGADPLTQRAIIAFDLITTQAVTIYPWETCRVAAERMAEKSVKRLPVVSPDDPSKLVGIVTLSDLLKSRCRILEEEARRERFFGPGVARDHQAELRLD